MEQFVVTMDSWKLQFLLETLEENLLPSIASFCRVLAFLACGPTWLLLLLLLSHLLL